MPLMMHIMSEVINSNCDSCTTYDIVSIPAVDLEHGHTLSNVFVDGRLVGTIVGEVRSKFISVHIQIDSSVRIWSSWGSALINRTHDYLHEIQQNSDCFSVTKKFKFLKPNYYKESSSFVCHSSPLPVTSTPPLTLYSFLFRSHI